jgi:uncharacterized protein with GYD domain
MLFMYVHTHPVEKCLAGKSAELNDLATAVRTEASEAGVAFRGVYWAPNEHTFFALIEADDVAAIQRAVGPLTPWGTARLIPVTEAKLD